MSDASIATRDIGPTEENSMVCGELYSPEFYADVSEAAEYGARQIVPLVFGAVRPASVVDVGCGTGTWAKAFALAGATDITGVDGDWVDDRALVIPRDRFIRADLTRPIQLPGRFDLCVSLEVAEHLPTERAAGFVSDLTALSDVVLFSAAVPFQGGTHHVNERWQAYWVALFAASGYVGIDYVRRRVWHLNHLNTWYYAQNTLIFVRSQALDRFPLLADEYRYQAGPPISLIHPGLLTLLEPWEKHLTVRKYFGLFPQMVARGIAACVGKIVGRAPVSPHPFPVEDCQWQTR